MAKLVKTLNGLKSDIVYETKNYKILTITKLNRGEDNGVDVNHSKNFNNAKRAGIFHTITQQIQCNMNGDCFEGNTRLYAHITQNEEKNTNEPIRFMLSDYSLLNNGCKEDFLDVIAEINSISKPWKGKNHYNTALKGNAPLAIEFKRLIDRLSHMDVIDKRSFKPTKIMGLLKKDVNSLHGKMSVRKEYENLKLVQKIRNSKRFITDLNYYIALERQFKISHEVRVIHEVFFNLVWNENINKKKLFHFIIKNGFNGLKLKKDIAQRTKEYATKKIRKDQTIIKITKVL